MVSNNNGDILYRQKNGKTVPASLRMFADPELTMNKLSIEPGAGMHPLVQVQFHAIIYGETPLLRDAQLIIDAAKEPEKDIFSILGVPSLRDGNYLFSQYIGKATFTANCLASNKNGVLFIEWTAATQIALRDKRAILAKFGKYEFAAIVPRDCVLPDLPERIEVVDVYASGCAHFNDVMFIGDFQSQMLSTINLAKVLVPSEGQPDRRTQTLIDLGAEPIALNGQALRGASYSFLGLA